MSKVILWGMSCVGKTTYAKSLDLPYFCFDYLFPWNLVESFPDLSMDEAIKNTIRTLSKESSYVLDGWHLSDIKGTLLPEDCEIHVLYDHHQNIIDRYRVPVVALDGHKEMYKKWYSNIEDSSRHRYYKINYESSPELTTFEQFDNLRREQF